jgi:hypothetical protein
MPYCPNGWKIVNHKKDGQLQWNPKEILQYLSDIQESSDNVISLALNVNVLDYLLAHPDQIPKECDSKLSFFRKTTYVGLDGYLYVRYLLQVGREWSWYYHRLSSNLDYGYHAKV